MKILISQNLLNILKTLDSANIKAVIESLADSCENETLILSNNLDNVSKSIATGIIDEALTASKKYKEKCLKNKENAEKRWNKKAKKVKTESVIATTTTTTTDYNCDDFVYFWQELAEKQGLSKISSLSDKRKKGIKKALEIGKKLGFNSPKELLAMVDLRISESSFLKKEWKITIDDIIKENKLLKVLEGGYSDKKNTNSVGW